MPNPTLYELQLDQLRLFRDATAAGVLKWVRDDADPDRYHTTGGPVRSFIRFKWPAYNGDDVNSDKDFVQVDGVGGFANGTPGWTLALEILAAAFEDWNGHLAALRRQYDDQARVLVNNLARVAPAAAEAIGPVEAASGPAMVTLEKIQPVLMCRDVPASLAFYARLGFAEAFRDDPASPRYAGVRRDGVDLHLQWHDASVWAVPIDRPSYRFVVRDVDGLYAEFSAKGALASTKATDVRDTPWGTREFHLYDPDRNGLQFYRNR